MICTHNDTYMYRLTHHDLMISWSVTLTDGVLVYGDYDRPDFDNPWLRLKEHCEHNDVYPTKIQLHMFGAPPKTFFENPDGLDGLKVSRGIAKDQNMDGGHSQSFQFLCVLLLNDDCSAIDVAKYTWPHNDFEESKSARGLTYDNLEHMIFKNGSRKKQHEEVQKHLYR